MNITAVHFRSIAPANMMSKQSLTNINDIIRRAKVHYPDLVYSDIIEAMQLPTSNLVLNIALYYYNDGNSKELLRLYGTVSTHYKGSRYNIPVEIWLQEDHPYEAPIAHVKPALHMYISEMSRDVQADGLIVLDYLNSWHFPTSNLVTLLQTMTDSFSRSSPVFSRNLSNDESLSSANEWSAQVKSSPSLCNASTSTSDVVLLPSASKSTSTSETFSPTTYVPTSNLCFNNVDKQKQTHRFCDIVAEPRNMLLPIQGYGKMPLVSLEEAVIPLVSLVPDVEQMVWIAKQNYRHPKDGLNPDESASVMLYTMEWEPYQKSFYVMLNTALRAARREELKPWFSYLRLIIQALHKLPPTPHTVYRGVKLDLSDQYHRGNTVVWWGFSSCTLSIETLKNERFLGKSGIRTLFSIECESGKNIRSHSYYADEDEVLLLPARQFEVVGCLDQGHGLQIVQLRETQPKFPLIKLPSS